LFHPLTAAAALSSFKKLLEAAVKERIAHGTLPAGVGARNVNRAWSFFFSDAGPAWIRQVDNLSGLNALRRLQTYVQEDFLTTELAFHMKFRRLLSHPRSDADLLGLEFRRKR